MPVNTWSLLDVALAALFFLLTVLILYKKDSLTVLLLGSGTRSTSTFGLPPGPPGLPILGNVLDMPSREEWTTFSAWGKQYGGICSVSLLGQVMVVINSPAILEELQEDVSSNFSSRPRLEMGGELCKYSKSLVLAPYGSHWRNYRKAFVKTIGTHSANARFSSMEELECYKFIRGLLHSPERLADDLRKLSGAIILSIAYGLEVRDVDDPFVKLIEKANDNFVVCCQPGHWLVDIAPKFMKGIPESLMPNGGFKAAARSYAKAFDDMVEIPFSHALKQIATGSAPFSFVSSLMQEDQTPSPDEIYDIKHAAASMYGGGADTTASSNLAFFLAMTLYPEVQKTAQAELDAVLGRDRLVQLNDRPNLPYVNALVSEVLRWHSVAPTGVPHVALEDGTIGDYHVPKGTIIVTNLWQMLHDEQLYPDPFKFDPSRHLDTPDSPAEKNPRFACFGWGRRVCPGKVLAEASLFLLIANTLATLNISKAVVDGKEITPVHGNTTGVISHPKPFTCQITPRNENTVTIVTEACDHGRA